jgi:hypothetical protein
VGNQIKMQGRSYGRYSIKGHARADNFELEIFDGTLQTTFQVVFSWSQFNRPENPRREHGQYCVSASRDEGRKIVSLWITHPSDLGELAELSYS